MPFGDFMIERKNGLKKFIFSRLFGWPPHLGMRIRAKLVERMLRPKRGERILEIGSNNGLGSLAVSKRGANVFGFDIEKKLVFNAHTIVLRNSKKINPPRFLVADAMHIPFASDTFDKTFSSDVLEHVPDDKKTLSEIYRVLKHGGYLILHVPLDVRYHISPLRLPRARERKSEIGKLHVRDGYIRNEIERILIAAGFSIEKIKITSRFFTAVAWEIDTNFKHRMRYFPFLYLISKLDCVAPPRGNGFLIKAKKEAIRL